MKNVLFNVNLNHEVSPAMLLRIDNQHHPLGVTDTGQIPLARPVFQHLVMEMMLRVHFMQQRFCLRSPSMQG